MFDKTLECFFEEHAQEVCERNWMNPEMQTALLKHSQIDCHDSEGTSRTTQRMKNSFS